MHPKLKVTGALTALALLLTAAFILSWLEMVLAVPMPLPGIKLGLANLAILFTLYYMGIGGALFVLIGRLVLSAALFGNAATLIFSAAGGLLSFTVMVLLRLLLKERSIVYVSIAGGAAHNMGQLAAASVVLSTAMWAYVPYLLIAGVAAGAINGLIARRLLRVGLVRQNKTHSSHQKKT